MVEDSGTPHDDLRHSVSCWIEDLKEGSGNAAHAIWQRYFDRLVRVAGRRMGDAPRRIADEEDIAVSVFHSLCEGAAAGRFDRLNDRDDLWRLLVAMTRMKSIDQIRRQTAQRRGGTGVRGESVMGTGNDDGPAGFDQFLGDEPTADFLLMLEEQRGALFDALPDASQRDVARLRMDGFTNEEIAELLGISLRSVERKLNLIRELWTKLLLDA